MISSRSRALRPVAGVHVAEHPIDEPVAHRAAHPLDERLAAGLVTQLGKPREATLVARLLLHLVLPFGHPQL